jgi:glycosyltransferase involved in cell wall biosynthesis
MRILEINKFYFIKGGAERHFFDVEDLLRQNNNKVAIFSMKHPQNKKTKWKKYFLSTVGYDSNYTTWQKLKGIGRMFYSREAKIKINKILDDFQPEIVHMHNIYHQLSPTILFEIKKRNIPIIMTVHDYKLVNPNYNLYHKNKFYNRCLNGKFYQCFFDKCIKDSYLKSLIGTFEMYWHRWLGTYEKNIDQYIVPSKFTKNILAERGLDESKIKVLPHFITQKSIAENSPGDITAEGKTEKYCLYVGRMINNKGIAKLINIFAKINGLKLYLAGEIDPGFNKLENKNVRYLGHLNSEKLKMYIKNSEFIVSSSQLPETFGLIALEANVQSKLFIGYKTGAYPEIIKNGQNGFLVENTTELENFIKSFEKYSFDTPTQIQQNTIDKYNDLRYYKMFRTILANLSEIDTGQLN